MRNQMFYRLSLTTLLFSCVDAWALPAYSRLFRAKYGYPVSCALCHTAGGGSATTDYGRDFLRAGANSPAFTRIEAKDSDKDAFSNLIEIQAKSNPGDAKSTPKGQGDWLSEASLVTLPEKQIKKLFPDAEALSALDGTLKDAQIKTVEAGLGSPLTDEDKVPTFYFVSKAGKKFGVAQFLSAKTAAGLISVAVAMDINAVIRSVQILKNPGPKSIEAEAFLKQFSGKTKSDKLSLGEDIIPAKGGEAASKEVASAVKKSVLIIGTVFQK